MAIENHLILEFLAIKNPFIPDSQILGGLSTE